MPDSTPLLIVHHRPEARVGADGVVFRTDVEEEQPVVVVPVRTLQRLHGQFVVSGDFLGRRYRARLSSVHSVTIKTAFRRLPTVVGVAKDHSE